MTGYTHCAHASCFAIIIGDDGDLCDDCRAEDEGGDATECNGCDNDSDIEVSRCKSCGASVTSSVRFPEDYPPHKCEVKS